MPTELSDFLLSRANLNCSQKTIDWYRVMLGHFHTWLSQQSLSVHDVRPPTIDKFLASMRESEYATGTIAQFYVALSAYYRWMLKVEIIASNPVAKVQRPKPDDYIPASVDHAYVSALYHSIPDDTWQDHRDRLVILLLWRTGLRVSGITSLLMADVNLDTRILRTRTKGKIHQMPFPVELVLPLWQWVNLHRPQCKAPEMLLCQQYRTQNIKAMSRSCVDGILRRRCKEAGLPVHSAHDYRHGFALQTLRSGASTRLVQKLLGHSNIQTTEKYLSLMPELTREMADKVWENQMPL